VPLFKRTVERSDNTEGKFSRLRRELDTIAKEYGKNLDEIFELFSEVACSKRKLVEKLQKERGIVKVEQEDELNMKHKEEEARLAKVK
jgi:hypothetical protein